jgi:uncharacterized membrane protein YiaA
MREYHNCKVVLSLVTTNPFLFIIIINIIIYLTEMGFYPVAVVVQ